MKIAGYETHPAADLFPLMEGDELQKLADDIKANGLQFPIVLEYDPVLDHAVVLDGRNRLRACELAGVAPTFTRVGAPLLGAAPITSPVAYVAAVNLRRRHLDASQRAMIGAALVPMFEAEAKERQRIGGREKGRANLPEADKGRAREKAAEVVNVSPRLVADALAVTREASPEIIEAVKRGEVAVSAAAKQTRDAKLSPPATHPGEPASGSTRRIPANIPGNARRSIRAFAQFLSERLTSADCGRLGRLLLELEVAAGLREARAETAAIYAETDREENRGGRP